MKSRLNFFLFLTLIAVSQLNAQSKKACDLTDVTTINSIMGTALVFDANSSINKTGKFECRYTDPAKPGKYIAVGLLESKPAYGYDMLTSDFNTNKNAVAGGGKAGGKFTKFFPYTNGGANAFYMTGPKDDYSSEALTFKFRKGDYILTISTNDMATNSAVEKLDALYRLFSSKL